jgi:hypothetical protein
MATVAGMSNEPGNQPKPPSKSGFSENWGLWVFALLFSFISLQGVPLVKFLTGNCYSVRHWFIDVFGSTGIIMISASMAITVGFEIIVKKGRVDLRGGLIIILAFFCYFEYGVVTGIIEKQVGQNQLELIGKLTLINVLGFCTMFMSGLLCFTPLSGILKKKFDVMKKKKKLSGKSRKGKAKV